MAGNKSGGSLAFWLAGMTLVVGSIAAMAWMWRSGGVTLATESAREVEECGHVVAGSSAITLRLAPLAVSEFLRTSGYEVGTPMAGAASETQIVGRRGAQTCTVTVRVSTAAKGFADLAASRALIALSVRPVTAPEIEAIRAAGAGDFEKERARAEHVFGMDAYAALVAADNPVQSLSFDNLRDIAVAGAMNWKDLGGPDAPVALWTPEDGTLPGDFPNDIVRWPNPRWRSVRERARIFENEAVLAAALAKDPQGLALMSASFAGPGSGLRGVPITVGRASVSPTIGDVRGERYPLVRRLIAYVRPADLQSNTFVQRFVAFLESPQAFDTIDAAGFGALRPGSRLADIVRTLFGCRIGTPESASLITVTRGAERLPFALRFDPGPELKLEPGSLALVEENAAGLRKRLSAGDAVILIGHADAEGDTDDNRTMGMRRAIAVRAAFEARGVLGIAAESAGEFCPDADNLAESGRLHNRRVDIWVRPAG